MSKLPSIVSKLPNDLRIFLDRVRETLGAGDLVTREDLVRSGLATSGNGGLLIATGTTKIIPPAPTGVKAYGALSTIILEWDDPNYAGHAYAEIWRSGDDDIGTAQLIGQTPGSLYADAVGGDVSVYYWVRFISITDDFGAYNGTAGTNGKVAFDPAYLIAVLSADNPNALLYKIPEDTVINGVPVAAGVYIRNLYFANGSVTSLMIGKEVVDDSHIANLSAVKVTFGEMSGDRIGANTLKADRLITNTLAAKLAAITTAYIDAGHLKNAIIDNAKLTGPIYSANWQYGVSGWLLNTDGKFYGNDGEFRGNLVAAKGTYAGDVHGGQFTGGAYTGYAWPAPGASGFYLGPSGLLLGNANNGKYVQITSDGNFYTPGMRIENGVLTIDQVNVIKRLNIAGGSVTISNFYSMGTNQYYAWAGNPYQVMADFWFNVPEYVANMMIFYRVSEQNVWTGDGAAVIFELSLDGGPTAANIPTDTAFNNSVGVMRNINVAGIGPGDHYVRFAWRRTGNYTDYVFNAAIACQIMVTMR